MATSNQALKTTVQSRVLKWLEFVAWLFIATIFAFVLHELGHYIIYRVLGYFPIVNWKYGTVYTYDSNGKAIPEITLPPLDGVLVSMAGPLVTLLLATCCIVLYLKFPNSFALFAFGMMNAVMRFNIIVDGFNSDEGDASEILLNALGIRIGRMVVFIIPLLVWTACIVLSSLLVKRQAFFRRTYWAIPLWVLTGFALTLLMRALIVTSGWF